MTTLHMQMRMYTSAMTTLHMQMRMYTSACARRAHAASSARLVKRIGGALSYRTVTHARAWWDPIASYQGVEKMRRSRHPWEEGIGRWMSSSARQEQADKKEGAKLPTMEAHLRKLYMRVHPDLFSSHPDARDTNEKSFQLLSEFLSAVKSQDGGRGAVGKVFKLVFFMRPMAEPGEGGGPLEEDLETVTVTLRADGSPRDKKKQLKKLFEACGISDDFSYDAASGTGSGRGGKGSEPVSDLERFIREQSHTGGLYCPFKCTCRICP